LVERYNRIPVDRADKLMREEGSPLPIKRVEKLMRELDYFLNALRLERSPDACFYLAETLFEVGRRDEAKGYVSEALRLCPRHSGALGIAG
jgi:tetratricopeptide (TPR) repeat protein